MKLTAQEEYGLRCVLQLARFSQTELADSDASRYLTIAEVGKLEGLSPQYAGKLLSLLVKVGLIESVRGRKGGLRLTREPGDISVAEVLRGLGGGTLYEPEVCDRFTGDRQFCVHSTNCSVRSLWAGLHLILDRVLSNTTLEDLCANEQSMSQWMQSHAESFESFHPIQDIQAFSASAATEKLQTPAISTIKTDSDQTNSKGSH